MRGRPLALRCTTIKVLCGAAKVASTVGLSGKRAAAVGATTALLAVGFQGVPAPAVGAAVTNHLPNLTAVRPGPSILYAPPANALQLQNAGIWRAPPILISGVSAYRRGEFLYQDYLYDDHGAKEAPAPATVTADGNDRRVNNQFSAEDGSSTYPSARAYAENAADIVEVRAKPLADATAFRVTFNTMNDPGLIAISMAIGGTAGVVHPFPDGANVLAPADLFLTVHPSGTAEVADLVRASNGAPVAGPAPVVTVDKARRQIAVRIPHADWDPGQSTVRLAAAAGLWDGANNRYLLPQHNSDATHPGGAGSAATPAAFFNVAFRYTEPVQQVSPAGGASIVNDPAWWRDRAQAGALAAGDISPFHADVDFHKLAMGADDESGVPVDGPMDRILGSHFEPAQGVNYGSSCYGGDFNCQYQGQLQPYAIYIPRGQRHAAAGYGMTLLLHANAANYNEFFGTNNQSQYGERGTGSVVITPEARDPGSSYTGYGAVDVFEVWADVTRRYPLDPTWQDISGYSLGGLGTFKLSEQFPDLFGRAVAIVGSPMSSQLPSLRNLPIMMWDVAPVDELNPYPNVTAQELDRLGYRYDLLQFTPGDHFTPAINDQYSIAADYLGTARVQPNPHHITYVYDAWSLNDGLFRPYGDFAKLGFVADHAYWLSGLHVRTGDHASGAEATIDAFSHGFGQGDPTPSGTQAGAGVLSGGLLLPQYSYLETSQTWGPSPAIPSADSIDLKAGNLSTVTIDVARADVDCNVTLNIQSDGPLLVSLAGCARAISYTPPRAGAHPALPATGTSPSSMPPAILVLAALAFGLGARRLSRRAHDLVQLAPPPPDMDGGADR